MKKCDIIFECKSSIVEIVWALSFVKRNIFMKNRIREVMQKANLSQQDFAAKLGVSPASISNIFIGRTNPTITHASAVHKAFPEVRMEWLLFGEGEMSDGEKSSVLTDDETENLGETVDFGDDKIFAPDMGDATFLNTPTSQKDAQPIPRPTQGSAVDHPSALRPKASIEVPDFASQNRFPTYNDLQNAKNCDKPERKVKEIRVFYDDGTYEIFIPAMK